MTLTYDGTPLEGGNYLLQCENEEGTEFKLIVQVVGYSKIVVSRPPIRTKYVLGERFDPTGIMLDLIYDDDRAVTVSDTSKMTFSQTVLNVTGAVPVTVTYEGLTTPPFEVIVVDPSVHSSLEYSGRPTAEGEYTIECTDDEGGEVGLHVTVLRRGTISSIGYSGIPTEVGEYTLPSEDDFGNGINLIVKVIDRAVEENNCYLIRYDEDGEYILPLPNIQSIEETLTASITEISTMIYGFDDNFVTDLGTTQKYAVTLRRIQPIDVKPIRDGDPEWVPQSYKDIDDWSESVNWSNGAWLRAFEAFIDGWQNLNWGMIDTDGNRTKEKVRSGGFRLRFWPPSESYREYVKLYDDLYPEIDRMGFISGSISPRFSGNNLQYLDVTIPLAVSSMIKSSQQVGEDKVTYLIGVSGRTDSFVHNLPVNIKDVAPNPPVSWIPLALGKVFLHWSEGSDIYNVGDRVEANSTLTADWMNPRYAILYKDVGDYLVDLEEVWTTCGGFTHIQAWVIGGGGGPGVSLEDGKSGGGGGSGDFVTNIFMPIRGFVEDRQSEGFLSRYLYIHVGGGGYAISQVKPIKRAWYYDSDGSYVAEGVLKDKNSTVIGQVQDYKPSTRYASANGGRPGSANKGGSAGGRNGGAGGDPDGASFGTGGLIPALVEEVVITPDILPESGQPIRVKCGPGVSTDQHGAFGGGCNGKQVTQGKSYVGGAGAVILMFFDRS